MGAASIADGNTPRPENQGADAADRSDNVRGPRARFTARAFALELAASFSERAVLAWLAERADASGRAWPRLDEGARVTGLRVRSIRRILARLEERGAVVRTHLARGERGPAGWAVSTATCVVTLACLLSGAAPLRGVSLAAWARSGWSTLERVVVALLEAHRNADGWAWPSYARLARLAGCSPRAIAGAVARLRRAGVLESHLVPQGALLPGGEVAREWRLVLRVVASCPTGDPRASSGGPSIADSRPDVHKRSADRASPIEDRPPSSSPPDPIGSFLSSYARIAQTDCLGRSAREIVRARLADGLSVRELELAAAGVAASGWHMAELSRRTIPAAFGTAERVRLHADRARARGGVFVDDLADPAREAQEARQAAERREREAVDRSAARARLRALGGAPLASLLLRGPAFR